MRQSSGVFGQSENVASHGVADDAIAMIDEAVTVSRSRRTLDLNREG